MIHQFVSAVLCIHHGHYHYVLAGIVFVCSLFHLFLRCALRVCFRKSHSHRYCCSHWQHPRCGISRCSSDFRFTHVRQRHKHCKLTLRLALFPFALCAAVHQPISEHHCESTSLPHKVSDRYQEISINGIVNFGVARVSKSVTGFRLEQQPLLQHSATPAEHALLFATCHAVDSAIVAMPMGLHRCAFGASEPSCFAADTEWPRDVVPTCPLQAAFKSVVEEGKATAYGCQPSPKSTWVWQVAFPYSVSFVFRFLLPDACAEPQLQQVRAQLQCDALHRCVVARAVVRAVVQAYVCVGHILYEILHHRNHQYRQLEPYEYIQKPNGSQSVVRAALRALNHHDQSDLQHCRSLRWPPRGTCIRRPVSIVTLLMSALHVVILANTILVNTGSWIFGSSQCCEAHRETQLRAFFASQSIWRL